MSTMERNEFLERQVRPKRSRISGRNVRIDCSASNVLHPGSVCPLSSTHNLLGTQSPTKLSPEESRSWRSVIWMRFSSTLWEGGFVEISLIFCSSGIIDSYFRHHEETEDQD